MSHWVTQGPRVEEFEKKFAAAVGAKYAVAVSSCTTALHLSLMVSGIGEGDEVICPSLSYIATANAVTHVRAKPVFAEVDPLTYNLDPRHALTLITRRTKAILVVHQMGLPADLHAFEKICAKHDLTLIEDAACAVGSVYRGEKIGSRSVLACFSFHPRKIITTGDGGMITTHHEKYCRRLKRLRQHGMSTSDSVRHRSDRLVFEEHLEIGYNYRMTDLQASVGLPQLNKLDGIVFERRKIAKQYGEALNEEKFLRLPSEPEGCRGNYQSYPLYVRKESPVSRDALMKKLWRQGISTKRGILTAHREPAYRRLFKNLTLPVSEDASDRSLLIPLYVPMAKKDINTVIRGIRSALRGK